MATDIDQWLFQHDAALDQQVTSVLAAPSCAPLYAALCRAYGSHFALDLGRTCIVQDGGMGLERSFNYWARYHLGLAPPPQHAPPPPVLAPVAHEPCQQQCAAEPACAFCNHEPAGSPLPYADLYDEPVPEPRVVEPAPVPQPLRTWSSIARGKTDAPVQPAILRRPRRFGGNDRGTPPLFAGGDGAARAAVLLGVTDDDFKSLLDAAPRPLVVCEPTLAAARVLLATALPNGVTVTTTSRAAVEAAAVDPAPAAYLVHLSPHLVATGITAALVAAAVGRGARVAAYCRGSACPEGALTALGAWWGSTAEGAPGKHAAARYHTEKGGDAQRRLLGALAANTVPPPSLVLVAGLRDAVALRKAVRREDFGRLVTRVDVVTLRVHRPISARAAAALQSGCGRQSRGQSVAIVPVGPDAHWGFGIVPHQDRQVQVLDTGSPGKAETTARAAVGAVVIVGGTDELQPAQPGVRPPTEAEYLHALAPPGALLAEVLRVRANPGELARSPALPLLVAWGLVRPGKEEVMEMGVLDGATDERTDWGDADADDGDLFQARTVTPPVPEQALHDWALVAAEWVSDRAALLALVGVRFCAAWRDATRADEALAVWLSLVGVFDELSTSFRDGVVIPERAREEAQRHRTKTLGLAAHQTDDFETTVRAMARTAKVDPDSLTVGSTSKEATAWCASVGVRAQALQQVAEGAAACADGLRVVLQRVRSDDRALSGARKGDHPLDRFVPGDEPAGDVRAATTAAFYRAASAVGPTFTPRAKAGHSCTCCPTPAPAALDTPTMCGKPCDVVPIGLRQLPSGKIVIETAMRRR